MKLSSTLSAAGLLGLTLVALGARSHAQGAAIDQGMSDAAQD